MLARLALFRGSGRAIFGTIAWRRYSNPGRVSSPSPRFFGARSRSRSVQGRVLKKVSHTRESRIERAREISWAVTSSSFLIVASLTEDAKVTFFRNGLSGERTYTTGHPSFSQEYLFLSFSLVNGLPHSGQFAIVITYTHNNLLVHSYRFLLHTGYSVF